MTVQTDRTTGLVGEAAFKVPCRAATTAAITLSGEQTVDGVDLVTGDRCLVKTQASSIDNGIYVVDTSDWERAKDADGSNDLVTGSLVLVTDGSTQADLVYQMTTAGEITIGTSALVFTLYAMAAAVTTPISVANGGTGAITAIAGLANLGVVQVTGEAGTANAQTGTVDALVTAFRADQLFIFNPSVANTGPTTLTLTPSGSGALAAKNIFANGAALLGGELLLGVPTILQYDGTQLNLIGYATPQPIVQNSQSAAYPLVLTDAGKHILHPTADNNARTFTIPANASVPYPIGTCITFVNQINTLTIAITTDTMTLAGAGTTGSRTLAASGIATAMKIGTTDWIISGVGLT